MKQREAEAATAAQATISAHVYHEIRNVVGSVLALADRATEAVDLADPICNKNMESFSLICVIYFRTISLSVQNLDSPNERCSSSFNIESIRAANTAAYNSSLGIEQDWIGATLPLP